MYHIKNDRRAKRSAETIYAALVTLMAEKQFEAISVSELVKRAHIGRATFYRNFDTIEDVLRWRCEQIVGEMIDYVRSDRPSQPVDKQFSVLRPMLRFFYLNSSIVELVIQANRTDILQAAFQREIEQYTPRLLERLDVPAEYVDYWPVIRSSMAVTILVQWVKHGKKETPDALADGLSELMSQMSKTNKLNVLL